MRKAASVTKMVVLSDRVISTGNALSMLLAATVISHGAVLRIVPASGPSLPPENATGIPRATA